MNPTKLSCPPMGELSVEWIDEAPVSQASVASNIERLEGMWPIAWSSIYAAFCNVVAEYEHDDYVEASAKRLIVNIPAGEEFDDLEWTVVIHTDPCAGVYEIQLQGASVIDAGVSF